MLLLWFSVYKDILSDLIYLEHHRSTYEVTSYTTVVLGSGSAELIYCVIVLKWCTSWLTVLYVTGLDCSMANSADPDQTAHLSSLIRVCTVC